MLFYANEDQLILQSQSAIADRIASMTVSRGSTIPLRMGFVYNDGTIQDHGTSPDSIQIKLIVKSASGNQRFDEAATLCTTAFTKSGAGSSTLYAGALYIGGPLIDKALGGDNISQAETVQITCNGDSAGSLAGRHFVLYDAAGPIWVWFKVSGAGVAPTTPTGFAGRLKEIDIATNAADSAVASAIVAAFVADTALSISAAGAVVTSVDKVDGLRGNADPDDTGFAVVITQAGADAFTQVDVALFSAQLQVQFNIGTGWQICQIVPLTIANNLDRNDLTTIQQVALSAQRGEADIAPGATFVTVTFPLAYRTAPTVVMAGPVRKLSPSDPTPALVEDQVSKTATSVTFDLSAPAPAAAKLPWLALP